MCVGVVCIYLVDTSLCIAHRAFAHFVGWTIWDCFDTLLARICRGVVSGV